MTPRPMLRRVLTGLGGSAVIAALVGGVTPLPAGATTPTAAIHPVRPTTARQVIVVSADTWGSSDAELSGWTWTGAAWRQDLAVAAGIGGNGFTADPHEADGFTPVGDYAVTTVFGSGPNPGIRFPFRPATESDHWVDDPSSPVYNTWQTGDANGRWASAETLSAYEYAIAFDFNQNPVVAGANSAIFVHEGGGPTPGCIEIDHASLLALLQWLDPSASPRIVLGVGAQPPAHASPAPVTTVPVATAPAPPAPPVVFHTDHDPRRDVVSL